MLTVNQLGMTLGIRGTWRAFPRVLWRAACLLGLQLSRCVVIATATSAQRLRSGWTAKWDTSRSWLSAQRGGGGGGMLK